MTSVNNVGEVFGATRGQRLQRSAFRVKFEYAHAFGEDVWVVARGTIVPRRRRLHLRIEPVGESRETTQQQHRRPGGRAVDPAAGGMFVGHRNENT
jgi:hypothetical protein